MSRRMVRSLPPPLAVLVLLAALSSCARENDDADRAAPDPSYSAITVPARPLTGTLDAVLRQSSRDAARNRMQVWIFNGTDVDVEPTSISYDDSRLSEPIAGERLRSMPSGLERGFPLPLPEPRCGGVARIAPRLTVRTAAGVEVVRVTDDIGIVQRHHDAVCFERAVDRVVELAWDDAVPAHDGTGTLTLLAVPTGRPGRLEILGVGATPVFRHPTTTTWQVGRTIEGDDDPQRIELPVAPARCDSHAFFEAGGATAFRLRLRLDGEEGEFVLRMSPAGADAAIAYALDACGLS